MALSRIEPNADAANAQKAHKEVAAVLEADEKLVELGVDPLLIGSYARHVSIRRVKDVDMFARLNKATATTWPGKTYDHSWPSWRTRSRAGSSGSSGR